MVWLLKSFAAGPGHSFLKKDQAYEHKVFGFLDRTPHSVGRLLMWWVILYATLTLGQSLMQRYVAGQLGAMDYAQYAVSLSLYTSIGHFMTVCVLVGVTAWMCQRYRRLTKVPES